MEGVMNTDAETTVPVLMISEDWAVDDISTTEECDDAFVVLTEQIAGIQQSLLRAHHEFNETGHHPSWTNRAKTALRMKKAALQMLQRRRGDINRKEKLARQESRDREFIELFRKHEPEAFLRIVEIAKMVL